MTTTDINGRSLEEYPERVQKNRLLGINGEGFAEYLEDDTVVTAKLDADGSLTLPAPEFGIAHDLSLSEFQLDLATYLEATADEIGEWRALSSFARQYYGRE
jgi:hypothetical protein